MTTPDSLLLLRQSIASSLPPSLSPTDSLDTASALAFPALPPVSTAPTTIPLDTLTRFVKDNSPVDLRSLYFAWQQRDTPITDYIAAAQTLGVTHLGFIERLELVTYLEGGQDDSDHITPLAPGVGAPAQQTGAAAPSGNAAPTKGAEVLVGKVRQTDPRLLEIYSYERVVANRNTMLRGIKPTDFSHVRKQAEDFITRLRTGPGHQRPHHTLPTRPGHPPNAPNPALMNPRAPRPSKPRAKDPIILLSPSASALLTMSNIKPFLESGVFQPPMLHSSAPQLLHISRTLPDISSSPLRFIIVDSPDKFKPDYWDRVVAVFTTGQAWQFKTYKWSNPMELFTKVAGFYVGWDGEAWPEGVKKWGNYLRVLEVERDRRFRDREVCEKFWETVERSMKVKGWGK